MVEVHPAFTTGITFERSRPRDTDLTLNTGLTLYSTVRKVTLSGYAFNRQGKALAFSILVNAGRDADVWKVRRGIDQLCSAMVESELPDFDSVGPTHVGR